MENATHPEWQITQARIFWGEIAPTDHVVQIYEDDETFFNLLEGFIVSGLESGEAIFVIATKGHLVNLESKLTGSGFDVLNLYGDKRLVLIDAEATLEKFMIDGWPDPTLFNETISAIIKPMGGQIRNIRVFGELVAVLVATGQYAAAIHLEHLWNRFCQTKSFCLFCAYPKSGFAQDLSSSLHTICCAHSKMISGDHRSKTTVFYKTVSGD